MTHTTLKTLTLLAAVWSFPLYAADAIQAHWNEVCRAAGGNQLTITTFGGTTVEGYCLSVSIDEITVTTTNQRVVRIARKTLSRIEVQRSQNNGHQLIALGRGVHAGLRTGVGWLLSPYAPLGIVAVPVTLAWGAVAAPFCALADLTHRTSHTQEIQVI